MSVLDGLPEIPVDRRWEERVRGRCHSVIERRLARERRREAWGRFLEAATVAAVSGYLAAVFHQALRLAGGH